MDSNVLLNRMETAWNIYKTLNSLVLKSHHELLSKWKIFIFCLILIDHKPFYKSCLYPSDII